MADNEAATIVIFGATGDLTRRKLLPALFHAYRKKRLPDDLEIIGFGRRDWDDDAFRERMRAGVQEVAGNLDRNIWDSFSAHLSYQHGDLEQREDFGRLTETIDRREPPEGSHRIYYLAVAPRFFFPTIKNLGAHQLARETRNRRSIVIEKPFGHDLASAVDLDDAVHKVFAEDQVYRIDHYLGKETAQNLLYFRFANAVYEPIWNRNYISNVQITVAESVDVGHRAGYYDQAGVLRDMFQNHLLQLLTLVTMEPPAPLDATTLRNEKVKVLNALRAIDPKDTVPGQYAGYRETPQVAPQSPTATYGALKLYIDNWRWQDVPFYLRSGKSMARKASEINIEFKRPPYSMFCAFQCPPANRLAICIQPDEGIHFSFDAKVPGQSQEVQTVDMEFHYRDAFESTSIPDAYERLLLDVVQGDASLFARSDEIRQAWKLMDPLIEHWDQAPRALAQYPTGSWGPEEADALLGREGHQWQMGCSIHDR